MKRYYPLFVVEAYLLVSILLFLFGPIEFNYHNSYLFFSFLTLYHITFILGYLIAAKSFHSARCYVCRAKRFSTGQFYILFGFGCVSVLISYSNLMLTNDLSVGHIWTSLATALSDPGSVYTRRMEILNAGVFQGSRVINIISVFFIFTKLLFVFYSIYFWRKLGKFKKSVLGFFVFFYVIPGIAAGVNSLNFYLFLFSSIAIFIKLYVNGARRTLRRAKWISVFGFCLLVLFFGRAMSFRGGGFGYFASTSPLGDISARIATPNIDAVSGYVIYSFVWLTYYVVQGYYGFSLALGMPWNWTWGFGSSAFLQNQFAHMTGTDISKFTLEGRLSQYWDSSAQWFTFYTQMANDVGFAGVAFVMFFLGYLLAKAWLTYLFRRDFYGAALLPILGILFIFIPANNQIFGNLEAISYFCAILLLWFFDKLVWRNNYGI